MPDDRRPEDSRVYRELMAENATLLARVRELEAALQEAEAQHELASENRAPRAALRVMRDQTAAEAREAVPLEHDSRCRHFRKDGKDYSAHVEPDACSCGAYGVLAEYAEAVQREALAKETLYARRLEMARDNAEDRARELGAALRSRHVAWLHTDGCAYVISPNAPIEDDPCDCGRDEAEARARALIEPASPEVCATCGHGFAHDGPVEGFFHPVNTGVPLLIEAHPFKMATSPASPEGGEAP